MFVRASDLVKAKKLRTGILTIDTECGGLSHPSFVVISGEYGSGKTALGYQLLSYALMDFDQDVAVIDTEGTFSLKRFAEIAKAHFEARGKEFDHSVLDRLHVALAPTLEELIGFKGFRGKKPVFEGRGVFGDLERINASAVLIDSLGIIREEFAGRELLYARTKAVARLVREIAGLRARGASVIATNHIYEGMKGRDIYGGTYIKHFATYHILIEKKEGIRRKIVALDFPDCPNLSAGAFICRAGLIDRLEADEEEIEECCGAFVESPRHPLVCKKLNG